MKKYLIDVNLPRYFSLWHSDEYEHVININDEMKDSEIWEYAKKHHLTIITKDADFSDMVMLNDPPPKVIHIKMGNMKMKEFHSVVSSIWDDVLELNKEYKLLRVYKDRVEGIG